MSATRDRALARRALHIGWMIARVLVSIVLIVILLVVFCIDLPAVRQLAIAKVNDALVSAFAGKIVIENVNHLGFTGLDGARVHIVDPEGVQVIFVDGVRVRISTFAAVKSFLFGKGDLDIEVSEIGVDYVDANLNVDSSGALRLGRAFMPNGPSAPASRGTAVHLPHIAVAHVWAHGSPTASLFVDAFVEKLTAAVVSTPQRLAIDLDELMLQTRGAPSHADLHVKVGAHYEKPASSGEDQSIVAKIDGDIGGIPTTLDGSMVGPEIKAVLNVPMISPDKVEALSPGAPLHENASLHVDAHGRLPNLEAVLKATFGTGEVNAELSASLDKTTVAHAAVDLTRIDVRAFSPESPPSALNAHVAVDVTAGETATTGTYALDVQPGTFARNIVPHAHIAGSLTAPGKSSPPGLSSTLTGVGRIDEKGAPVDLSLSAQSSGPKTAIKFDVASRVPNLDETRLGDVAKGSLSLHAAGALDLARVSSVDARVDVTGSRLAQGTNRVEALNLDARLRGPLDAAAVDARVTARAIAVGDTQFATAVITAKGNAKAVDVTALTMPTNGPKLEGSARIELGELVTVRRAKLVASRDDVRAVLGIESAKAGKGQVHVEGLVLEGVGDTLRAEAHRSSRGLTVRASTAKLDLRKLSRLFRNQDLDGGQASFDVDLTLAKERAKGHVRFDVDEITIERVKNARAHVDFTVDGRELDGIVHAELGKVGQIEARAEKLEIGEGDLRKAAPWRDTLGTIDLAANLDVAKARALFPKGSMPFDEMTGQVKLEGEVERDGASRSPRVSLSVRTAGLVLSAKSEHEQVDGARVFDSPPWRIEGVDFAVDLGIQSKGDTELTLRVFDRPGELATCSVQGDSIPYADWLEGAPLNLSSLSRLPLRMAVVVPTRDLKTLPTVLKTRGWSGTVAGRLDVDGSLATPTVHLAVVTQKVYSSSLQGVSPLDGTVDARYDHGQTKVVVGVDSNGSRLLDGRVDAEGEFPRLLDSREQILPWRASSKIHLAGFPLASLTKLADLKMKGNVTGDLVVNDLHRDARLEGDLTFDRLRVGKVDYPKAHAQVSFDGNLLKALLHLEQTDGSLDTTAEAGMSWNADVVPHVQKEKTAILTLKAKHFRAEALLPFASGSLSDLAGRIDGDAHVELGAGTAKMQGVLTLDDGKFQLVTVGEPFSGVHAKVTMSPDGIVRLDDVVAHGSTGTVNMKGYAKLNGFALSEAKASIHIPKTDALPVDADGQEIGNIDGDIDLTAVALPDKKQLDLRIDIPTLHTLLPENDTHVVQELNEPNEIHVGYHRRPTIFIKVPEVSDDFEPEVPSDTQPTVTKIAINLGKDIEVKKGTSLRVALDGNPVLIISDKARMTGHLRLKRGFLDVQGHHFDIEKGTVTFVGDDPGNPQVLVTAVWKAPEGSLVYADFTGPLKTGKVTLRSEPAHTQNEIISLIMFGSADGQTSSSYQSQDQAGVSTTGKAGAAAGGFATEGLSKGLNDLTGLDVAAKVDTSTANPRPEVVLQISRTVSLQLGYVVGTLPLTNPDRTLVTVGWRFIRNWEMDGTYGNAGTTLLDWIWQYQY